MTSATPYQFVGIAKLRTSQCSHFVIVAGYAASSILYPLLKKLRRVRNLAAKQLSIVGIYAEEPLCEDTITRLPKRRIGFGPILLVHDALLGICGSDDTC